MGMLLREWMYLPGVLENIFTTPAVWGFLTIGVIAGYIIGVVPGLGPTMGMALSLGIIFSLPPTEGMALLVGILVASLCSGGITASLANIPGTSAAAATCLDGYPMTLQGRGRDAAGLSYMSSIIGGIIATITIFIIQPFISTIALKFGDWEVFLFCLFGLMICGSLSGDIPVKGWIAAVVGLFFSMVGADGVQSIIRFNFGLNSLLSGFDTVIAMIGLFGLGEVLYILVKDETFEHVESEQGFPRVRLDVLIRNKLNLLRSTLAGLWVGFIPGVGESAACWFSYDLAKRSSDNKEKFGKGCEEGIIAAETANNASSIGALIPALALGVPGSATAAIFIAAMYMMNYRPGPTLMTESPGILSEISVLLILASLLMLVVGYVLTRFVIRFLTIPNTYLMPMVAVFCAVGSYGSAFNMFSLVMLLFFGLIGFVMKLYDYPIAPMVLGLLVGNTADTSLRRALMQYGAEPLNLILRPFGLAVMIVLIVLFVISIKTSK